MIGVRPKSPIQTTSVSIEQAALGQVVEQGGVGLLHRRHEPVLQPVEVVLVRVPGDARAVDRGDEADAGLDEPAGQQVRLAPGVPAVALADRVRLLATDRTPAPHRPLTISDSALRAVDVEVAGDRSATDAARGSSKSAEKRVAGRCSRSVVRRPSARPRLRTRKSAAFGSAFSTNGSYSAPRQPPNWPGRDVRELSQCGLRA